MSQIFAQATPRTQAPYRNDVVGSFLRTDALKNAKIELQTGKINQAAFDKILRRNSKSCESTKTPWTARRDRW